MRVSSCWFSLNSVGRVWFPFLLIPELHNAFRGWCLGFKYAFVCFIVHIHTETSTMVSSCSSYKQTYPCLQMKTNIDEIKLGREYLISELHVWIKLGFLYWIKPVGIGSMSSIWENRRGKKCPFVLLFFSLIFLSLRLCHSSVLGDNKVRFSLLALISDKKDLFLCGSYIININKICCKVNLPPANTAIWFNLTK